MRFMTPYELKQPINGGYTVVEDTSDKDQQCVDCKAHLSAGYDLVE